MSQESHFIIGHVFVESSFDPFPLIFSSPTTTQTPLTGIRLNPCPTLLWGGPSGHLANPTSNTEDEEEVTGLLFFGWLALKRQKRERCECFCLESDGGSCFQWTNSMCQAAPWLLFAWSCPGPCRFPVQLRFFSFSCV